MNLRIAVLSITILLSSGSVSEALACTCGESTVAEHRKRATAVFVGKVVAKRKSDAVEKDGVEVTLTAERVWKGTISQRVIVHTGATDDLYPFVNLCATPFRMGERYIVFAYGRDRLATDVCAGSGDFPYANGVIKQLGTGKRPRHLKTWADLSFNN
jgi:hypothetical protein